MAMIGTLLLASGAIIACGVLYRFSHVPLHADSPSLLEFLRVWRGRGNTPEGQRVVAWLELALSLQFLGAAVLVLWFLLGS
jgi:hypothetical protein